MPNAAEADVGPSVWLVPSAYFPDRGGVEEVTHQLAAELQRLGHRVLVVTPWTSPDLPRRDRVEGIDVRRMRFAAPRRRVGALLAYPFLLGGELVRLARLRGTMRPDIVHVHCASVQLLALTLLCLATRTPLVVTTHGETKMDANDLYGQSAFMRAVLRFAARRASALTACSAWTASAAAEVAPEFATSQVILNGVDLDQWVVSPAPTELVAVAWGRLVPQKGFDLLMAAFAQVRQEEPDAELIIGGDGPERERLAGMAPPGVTLVGALDRAGVQHLLDQSRVAVVPSRIEPFGVVALEAMATGRPVVWSTAGGLGEATGGLGWGADPTDIASLSRAIVSALRTEPDPSTFRARAAELSWSSACDRYLDVYRACLDDDR